jgi:hypothetical protein
MPPFKRLLLRRPGYGPALFRSLALFLSLFFSPSLPLSLSLCRDHNPFFSAFMRFEPLALPMPLVATI